MRMILAVTSAAVTAVIVSAAVIPMNTRLQRTQQVADRIETTVRWNAPQNPRGTPPPDQYEVEVRDDTVVLANSLGESDTRAVQFSVPYPCGDTIILNARVRAWNAQWPEPSAWDTSSSETWFRACPIVISGPPDAVTIETDTASTSPQDTVPPLGVTDLTYVGDLTLTWTEVSDGAGGPANYDLRFGCPTLEWGPTYPTSVTVQGTQVGATVTLSIAPPMPPCDYRMVSYRGILDSTAVFGGFSNVVTVTDTALTEPVVLLPLTLYPDGTARWLRDEPDGRAHITDGQSLGLCWYGVGEPVAIHPDGTYQTFVYGMFPSNCPTTEIGLPSDLPVYDASQVSIRCQGADSVFTPRVSADGARITCGEQGVWDGSVFATYGN